MIMPLKFYGDEFLRRKAEPVKVFDAEFVRLAANMAETMYAAPGIGLAAPQVGVSRRLIIVDISTKEQKDRLYQVANPQVLEVSDESEKRDEGCLSIPDFFEPVVRPIWAKIRGQDLQGQELFIEAEGLLARCLLHEIDHLEGVLFVDRMVPLRRKFLRLRLKNRFGAVSLPAEAVRVF